MSFFLWDPALSVGIKEIDQEHIKWISYIERLHVAVEKGEGCQNVKALLEEIRACSEKHFKREENLFSQTDYPDAEYHKSLHVGYLKELDRLMKLCCDRPDLPVTHDILLSLKTWLTTHIQDVDSHYTSYVVDKKTDI